jgi:ADP-heptose:LPS heptosyltransferase
MPATQGKINMKRILIINLRRLGDIYSSAHLVNSISSLGQSNISILVYQECAKAASSLTNVSQVYTINRKQIITLKSNKLFSDVDAFAELYDQMNEIKNQEWDQVINYSNDTAGTYLTSYIQNSAQNISGIFYNSSHQTNVNNNWSILFNDILTFLPLSPIHFTDCYHKISSTPYSFVGNKIKTSHEHNELARIQINSIRQGLDGDNKTAKIIGIQLKTSSVLKDLPTELVKDFIFLMRKSSELIPVLLIAPNDQERACAGIINEHFNDSIVVIETDLATLPSVLLNIDLLVSPDTAIKHIANLTNTPVLEISLGTSPFLKQGPYCADSLVLTEAIATRSFSSSNPTSITGMDVIASILYFFTASKTIRPLFSPNVSLYGARFDKLGIFYYPISGSVVPQIEISRLMNRQLVSVLFNSSEIDGIYPEALNYGKSIVSKWADRERNNITQLMRDLLSTLRALLQGKNRKDSSLEFVTNLGRLLEYCGTNQLTQIPCLLFKGKLELIRGTTVEENTKEVEVLLHELKSNVLKILFLLKQLDVQTSEDKQTITTRTNTDITV